MFQLTWADIAIAGMIFFVSQHHPDIIKKFNLLAELTTKVNNLPNIKAWMEKRPKLKCEDV